MNHDTTSSSNGDILNAMTVDVEDYYQVSNLEQVVDRRQWDDHESRVVANTRRILRLFARYERSLIIPTPVTSEEEMRENIREFNEIFGFRNEVRKGTPGVLDRTWEAAKKSLP